MIIDLDTSFRELHKTGRLSSRAYNCLRAGELNTPRDVLECFRPLSDLRRLRNLGKKCYAEIVALLSDVSSRHEVTLDQLSRQLDESMDGLVGGMLRGAYDSLFQEESNVTRYFQSIYPDVAALHKAVMEEEASLLLLNESFSFQENTELRALTIDYLKGAMAEMRARELENKQLYVLYQFKKNYLSLYGAFSNTEKLRYFFSPTQRACLTHRYEELKSGLSIRARNLLDQAQLTQEDMVETLDVEKMTYSRNSYVAASKTADELFEFNMRLKALFDRYWSLNEEECKRELVRCQFPYFGEEACDLIFSHYMQYGFYPRLFILYQYMRQAATKSEQAYSWLSGIQDGKQHSVPEVAERFQLTRERVRQLADSKMIVCDTEIVQSDEWRHYGALLSLPYIREQSQEWVTLCEREHLPVSFEVFCALIKLLGERHYVENLIDRGTDWRSHIEYQYELVQLFGLSFIVNGGAFPSWDFGACVSGLERLVKQPHNEDMRVSMDELLPGITGEEKANAASLIHFLATEGLQLTMDGEGNILLPRNHVDVPGVLYRILAEQGSPMSCQALLNRFKALHPDHFVSNVTQLKSYLYDHAHIKSIGKSGWFGLDSWEHVFYGTIRDLLVAELRGSHEPMHIDSLMEKVLLHYPKTNKRSVCWSMIADEKVRFVRFKNGYYGLTEKSYSDVYQVDGIKN